MEIFKNKFLVKLIASICLAFMLFSFTSQTKVYATESEVWGGVLIKPIIKLLTALCDGTIEVIQKNIEGKNVSFIKIEGKTSWWSKWGAKALGVMAGIVIAAGIIVGICFIPGAVAALTIGTVIKIGAATVTGMAVTGFFVADVLDGSDFPEDIYLPVFSVSLDQIFSDEVLLLDVNFFEPKPSKEVQVGSESKATVREKLTVYYDYTDNMEDVVWEDGYDNMTILIGPESTLITDDNYKYDALVDDLCGAHQWGAYSVNELVGTLSGHINQAKTTDTLNSILNSIDSALVSRGESKINRDQQNAAAVARSEITIEGTNETYDTGKISIIHGGDSSTGAKEIIILFTKETKNEAVAVTETRYSTAAQLQEVISTWYFILRNVALLVLMLVLIYTGIRITIGSTAGEKAKYKERLMDWIVALCLIMIMHYIMVFAVNLTKEIKNLVKVVSGENQRESIIYLTDEQYKDLQKRYPEIEEKQVHTEDGKHILFWNTDIMGQMKVLSQQENEGTAKWVGLALAYVVLVFYTIFFLWTYVRRVVYMAFLTIIAPLVAMTYPIDKITDGKAQAFNMWLREYIFNLLIQPMHLLLYTILVTSAYELASVNVIYTLVAIGFMIPAEKLVRKFFGFEKAQTPGLLGGAAGAALAMTGMQRLLGHHPKGNRGSNTNKEKEDSKDIKFSSNEGVDTFGTLLNGQGTGLIGTRAGGAGAGDTGEGVAGTGDTGTGVAGAGDTEVGGAGTGDTGEGVAGAGDTGVGGAGARGDGTGGARAGRRGRHGLGRTIAGVSGAYARALGKKALKRVQNGHPIRTMARGAVGLAGGALFGATGLALGIASGDPNKAFQYAATGALGGYGAGAGLGGAAVDTLSVNPKEMEEEAKMSWYGEEYKNVKYDEEIEKDLMSEKNINYLRTVFGYSRKEAKDFLDTTGRICHGSGVKNVEDMAAIQRAMEEEEPSKAIPTLPEAIAATKLKNRLPQKISSMSDKKLDEYRQTYKATFAKKLGIDNEGLTSEQKAQINALAQEKANVAIRYMKNIESANSSLTQV